MAGAGPLYELNRLGMLMQLRSVQRSHGHCAVGVVAESILAAVAEYLRETQGPEAACNALYRHADRAAEPVIAARTNPHHQGE